MYRERRVTPALSAWSTSVWAATASGDSTMDPIIPDGSMDIMWDGNQLLLAGPDTTWWLPDSRWRGRDVIGLRVRPGRGAALLGLPATEVVDARLPLSDLWRDVARWEDQLAASDSASDRARTLERLASERVRVSRPGDPIIDAAIGVMARRRGPGLVHALGVELAVSERQLLRRFRATIGYGPKRLDRVLRLQRFLGVLAATPDCELAWAAAATGFSDQAHLSREAMELSGRTPSELRVRAGGIHVE